MCKVLSHTKGEPRCGYQKNLSIFGSYPKLWLVVSERLKLQPHWVHGFGLGGDKVERKSTSGGCQFLGRSLVSWSSKKQNRVSLSTTEAEYIAAASCCAQLLWMRQTLKDYCVTCDKVPLLCDNESAIKIAYNNVQHSKTKHIEIRHHFIRDHVKRGDIDLSYVGTGDQLANIFTKPLDEARFRELRHELNIIDSSNAV